MKRKKQWLWIGTAVVAVALCVTVMLHILLKPRKSEHSQIKVISNRVASEQEGKSLFNKLNAVVSKYLSLRPEYLGSIPQDQELSNAVMQQMPVSLENPKAKSAIAYENIAAILMNKEVNKKIQKRGMAAFFSHIVAGKKTT